MELASLVKLGRHTGTIYWRNVFLLFIGFATFATFAAFPVGSPVLPPSARSQAK